ncbi:MAG TPA: RHS repeat-associated core domain-containing protein [Thermoanaerobaculia bacterium]|nr:RHS repeat-associated core domain-containing protein [Thermoanaerobaculia bacterium]
MKHFDYDIAAGWGSGKVAKATRYNYPLFVGVPHTVQILETYTYNGLDGRASKRDTEMTYDGTPKEAFTQSFTWTVLGDVDTLTYPACIVNRCPATTSRTVTNGYTNGYLTSVASGGLTYATINYHLNRMVNQVAHANTITDTYTVDASGMARPGSITSTLGTTIRWTTGAYSYDGAGDITKMGTSWFTYDKVSRLTTGTVFTGTAGGGTQKQQTYTFDAFGNLTAIGGSPGRNIAIDASTNRLVTSTDPATLTSYDSAGNLTAWNGAATYDYDAFNQMWRMKSGSEEWLYIYTADNERVWSFKVGANFSRWTLRDLGNKVLREYNNNAGTWSIADDYLYRGALLLAGETPSGRRHFHLDHLGTPRLITDAAGSQVAYHVYYPFGEEATAFNQDTERMKFTGHERDLASLAGAGDDLDYMHERFCSPLTSRFLNVDPLGGEMASPGSWNRYALVLGNPLKRVDPDGFAEVDVCAEGKDEMKCGGTITVSASHGTTDNPFTGLEGLEELVSARKSGPPENEFARAVLLRAADLSQRPVEMMAPVVLAFSAPMVGPGEVITIEGLSEVSPLAAARNLKEALAIEEALAGQGEEIMEGKIGDPRFPPTHFAKMEYVHRALDGTKITLHYWKNKLTNVLFGFKFK